MSRTDELVSVIVPTRNRHAVVERAVRSALRQTYRNVEVIVADDASTPPVQLDGDLLEDGRVRLVRLTSWSGAGAARNAGVEHARGTLLAFVDDDDEWLPGKLEEQVSLLACSPADVAAVETGWELWDDGRLLLRFVPKENRDLRRTLLERPCLQPSTVLIRRECFDALGGFGTNLARTEDWFLWLDLADRYRAAVIPRVYVRRAPNRDTSAEEMLAAFRAAVERVEPRVAALPAREQARIRSAHAVVEGSYLLAMGRAAEARTTFIRAWRHDPRAWRPPVQALRTVVGERGWVGVKRAAALGQRLLGRDPLLTRW